MKSFFILIKIITVGLFWSVFFLEGVRVILYQNWRFDILNIRHWIYVRDYWLSGWVVNQAKEWAFVLILLTSIPLWLTGWAALSMVKYGKIFKSIFGLPLKFINSIISNKTRFVANKIAVKTVSKKKSHKEVRPPARDGSSAPSKKYAETKKVPTAKAPMAVQALPTAPKKSASSFEHSLFDFDDNDDDFNFDLDAPIEKPKKEPKPTQKKQSHEKDAKSSPKKQHEAKEKSNKKEPPAKDKPQQQKGSSSSIIDIIKEKGYGYIPSVSIKSTMIDFVAYSQDRIVLLLIDKEHGDWLADEEKFNGEEPLWFSESSHRISPVRRVDVAKETLIEKIDQTHFPQKIEAIVVNQMNNIINAEDMLDIWKNMGASVTRIDRGTPKELPLFSKTLPEAESRMAKEDAEKLKKILRGAN